MMVSAKAFVGVSLDNRAFKRSWFRWAISSLLARHGRVLFLLADDLMRWTRTANAETGEVSFVAIDAIVSARSTTSRSFIQSEVQRLPSADRGRILIKGWQDFSDRSFVALWRNLRIAYAANDGFKTCVDHTAALHVRDEATGGLTRVLNAEYVLDEMAMCLRVTELAGFHYEYYPGPQIEPLEKLYAGAFSAGGLSVAGLTGDPPQRVFASLTQETSEPR
jgi:hypothetical protein